MFRRFNALLQKIRNKPEQDARAAAAALALARLREQAEELGLEVGLHGLPHEPAIAAIKASLRQAAGKLYGLQDSPPALLEKKTTALYDERLEVQAEIAAHQAQPAPQPGYPSPLLSRAPICWSRAVANVIVFCGLITCALRASGFEPGQFGYIGLGLGTVLFVINLPILPSLTRLLSIIAGYEWARFRHHRAIVRRQKRLARLDERLAEIRQQRDEAIVNLRLADEWEARHDELLVSYFNYQRERAELAIQQAPGGERSQAAMSAPKVRTIAMNSAARPGERVLLQKEPVAAQSGLLP